MNEDATEFISLIKRENRRVVLDNRKQIKRLTLIRNLENYKFFLFPFERKNPHDYTFTDFPLEDIKFLMDFDDLEKKHSEKLKDVILDLKKLKIFKMFYKNKKKAEVEEQSIVPEIKESPKKIFKVKTVK
jgi:hypothetical protein